MKKPGLTKDQRHKRRQWIEQAFAELMQEFGLLPCHIAIEDSDDEGAVGDFARAIGVQYNYPYPQLSIVLCPLAYRMTEEELKRSVFHEVMHLLLWELKNFRKESDRVWGDLEEKIVEKLAMFFVRSNAC